MRGDSHSPGREWRRCGAPGAPVSDRAYGDFMSVVRIVLAALLLPLGAIMVHFGDVDDSPGFGGLGLIVGLTGVFLLYRQWRRRRMSRG